MYLKVEAETKRYWKLYRPRLFHTYETQPSTARLKAGIQSQALADV